MMAKAGAAPVGPPAAEAPAPAPVASAPPAPALAAGALSQVVTTGTRGEVTLKSPDSRSLVSSEAMHLDGCWNITAPDSLRTLLRNPTVRRVIDDTLMLEFMLRIERRFRVVQNADTLRGEITAKRVECPKP